MIAATNRDLRAMVRDRQFREDLFYRLNVFAIGVPPLRERRDDIPLLVRHFADHFARRMNKVAQTIPSDVMRDLTSHEWPGNIRELQNMIERAVILSPGPVLQLRLPLVSAGWAHAGGLRLTLQEVKRLHIIRTLEATDWVVSGPNGAAAILRLKRTTLQSAMAKLAIHKPTASVLRVV